MLFFEDLKPGAQFNSANFGVTAEEIIAFARQYDPQPFHTDEGAAKTSFFGQLVASGWHTAAITMRLLVQGEMQFNGGMIGQGIEGLRWPRPVRAGDTLRLVVEVVTLGTKPSRSGRGRVKILCRTYNQDGQLVQEMTANLLAPMRPVQKYSGKL